MAVEEFKFKSKEGASTNSICSKVCLFLFYQYFVPFLFKTLSVKLCQRFWKQFFNVFVLEWFEDKKFFNSLITDSWVMWITCSKSWSFWCLTVSSVLFILRSHSLKIKQRHSSSARIEAKIGTLSSISSSEILSSSKSVDHDCSSKSSNWENLLSYFAASLSYLKPTASKMDLGIVVTQEAVILVFDFVEFPLDMLKLRTLIMVLIINLELLSKQLALFKIYFSKELQNKRGNCQGNSLLRLPSDALQFNKLKSDAGVPEPV